MTALLLSTFLACGGADAGSQLDGTLTTADYSVTVANSAAFGFHIDDQAYLYVASNPDATCADVVDYLTHSSSSEAYDPTAVWLGGTCNLLLSLSGYDGSDFSFGGDDNYLKGFWNLNCAMGEGEFVYETRNNYTDYYWSEQVWIGGAEGHDTTVTHETDASYTITTTLTSWRGNYNDQLGDVPMEGSVTGTVQAEWCSDLYQSGLWGN